MATFAPARKRSSGRSPRSLVAKIAVLPTALRWTNYAITEVPSSFVEADPYPDYSFGWQVVYGTSELTPLGWAYPESLDTEQQGGAPGWTTGRIYTLWPGVAWEL